MEQRLRESLSALLDGEADELESHRVLAWSNEAELRTLWARYHRVRTVMGVSDTQLHDFDISRSIAAALDQGDVASGASPLRHSALAQAEKPSQARSTDAQTRPATPTTPAANATKLWKLSGIAASIAVAFVVGLNFKAVEPNSPVLDKVVAAQPADSAVLAQHVARQNAVAQELVARDALASAEARQPKLIDRFTEAHAKRFNSYLLRHAENAALSGRQGVVPLARVASVNSMGMSDGRYER